MKRYKFEADAKVLIYPEAGETVAHCLDFDLLGYGRDDESALESLNQAIENVMSFSVYKNEVHLLHRPAPAEYFDRWEKARKSALEALGCPDRAGHLTCRATIIRITPSLPKKGGDFRRLELAAA